MPVPQQLVIDRIKTRCSELDRRYDGYQRDLVNALADILGYERANEHNIVQRVKERLEVLGDLHLKHGGVELSDAGSAEDEEVAE
jgi:hypothetical protein